MIAFSVVLSFFTKTGEQVAAAASQGAADAVKLCLELIGIMAFWNGIMNVASRSGVIDKIAVLMGPVYRLLFKKIPETSVAGKNILLNITANVLGLGNAATPFGLKAMHELGKEANGTATNEMILFVVINTASIQLIPTTIISMRAAYGSGAAAEIIVPVWIVSVIALLIGILAVRLFKRE